MYIVIELLNGKKYLFKDINVLLKQLNTDIKTISKVFIDRTVPELWVSKYGIKSIDWSNG